MLVRLDALQPRARFPLVAAAALGVDSAVAPGPLDAGGVGAGSAVAGWQQKLRGAAAAGSLDPQHAHRSGSLLHQGRAGAVHPSRSGAARLARGAHPAAG